MEILYAEEKKEYFFFSYYSATFFSFSFADHQSEEIQSIRFIEQSANAQKSGQVAPDWEPSIKEAKAQTRITPSKWDTYNSQGFWDTNILPNPGQKTKPAK